MPKPFISSSFLNQSVRAAVLLGATLICHPIFAADGASTGEVKRTEPMQAHQGYSREHCMELSAGSTLDFHFETPQIVDFNIHHHPDKGPTVFAARQAVTKSLAKSIAIKDPGEYCFQWTNPADRPAEFPITLTYQVK